MSKEKYVAIVLKAVKYAEHDKMLTLYTRESGKISAVAKGALSLKCKYLASSQLFALSEFVLSTSSEEKLPYVVSADLISSFGALSQEYSKTCCASYALELMTLLNEDSSTDRTAFNLLYYTLKQIDEAAEDYSLLFALSFALKFTAIAGIGMNYAGCIKCKEEKSSYTLHFDEGGTVCVSCLSDFYDYPTISSTEAKYLNMLTYADITTLGSSLLPDRQTLIYLIGCIDKYLSYTFSKKTKSFELIKSLQ